MDTLNETRKRQRDQLADDRDFPDHKKRASGIGHLATSDKVAIKTDTRDTTACREVPKMDSEQCDRHQINDLFTMNENKCDIKSLMMNSSRKNIAEKSAKNQTRYQDGSIKKTESRDSEKFYQQFSTICSDIKWITYNKNNLNYAYTTLYGRSDADAILSQCEEEIVYNTESLAQVKVFGKIHNIPRKQVAFGDAGLTYTFSGSTVPANSWPQFVIGVRDRVEAVSGERFNFVLVNRYRDGDDHIGEHKDDEKDLVPQSSIASVSFGQPRDFLFKHQDMRGTKRHTRPSLSSIDPVSIELGHGSLLLMKDPTNEFWYHSLPKRKRARGVRVNLTFRNMSPKSV